MGNQRAAIAYLQEALDDYDALSTLIQSSKYKKASFFIQQCVEKILKALAFYSSDDVPWDISHTHDIQQLYDFAYRRIGNDQTLLPPFISQYLYALVDWETKGRYPAYNYEIWAPDASDVEDMDSIASQIPAWYGEVEYIVNNM